MSTRTHSTIEEFNNALVNGILDEYINDRINEFTFLMALVDKNLDKIDFTTFSNIVDKVDLMQRLDYFNLG